MTNVSYKPRQRIGRYELIQEISKGAIGPLWALKFEHEGESLLALGRVVSFGAQAQGDVSPDVSQSAWHATEVDLPGVGRVVDALVEETTLMLVYNYVEAESLWRLERHKTAARVGVSVGVAIRMTLDVLEALRVVHASAQALGSEFGAGGVNQEAIFVGIDGRTQLLDAFIGSALSRRPSVLLEPGRARTAAPEQLRQESLDIRSDVYSVGCILWELLANQRMYLGSGRAIRQRVLAGRIPKLAVGMRAPSVLSEELVEIVGRCIEVEPADRFQTLDELVIALQRVPEQATHDEVGNFVRVLAKKPLDNRRRVTAGCTIANLAQPEGQVMRGWGLQAAPRASSVTVPKPEQVMEYDEATAEEAGEVIKEEQASPATRAPEKQTLLGIPSFVPSSNAPVPPGEGPNAAKPSPKSHVSRRQTLIGNAPPLGLPSASPSNDASAWNTSAGQQGGEPRPGSDASAVPGGSARTLPSVAAHEPDSAMAGVEEISNSFAPQHDYAAYGPNAFSDQFGTPLGHNFDSHTAETINFEEPEDSHPAAPSRRRKLGTLLQPFAWFLAGCTVTLTLGVLLMLLLQSR